MRILLATLGSRGDVEPFLHLARAAVHAGHTVRVIAPDDPVPGADDLDIAPVSVSFAELATSLDAGPLETARAYRETLRPAMARALAESAELAADWSPDAVVAHPKLLTLPAVATRLDVRLWWVELTPTLTPSREFPAAGVASRSLGPLLNRLSYRVVAAAGGMFRDDVRAARERYGVATAPAPAVGTLAAMSPALVPRPRDWPASTVLTGEWRSPSGEVDVDERVRPFLDDDTPFVYAGFGSMSGGDAVARTEAIVDGARRTGHRVLLATGWGGLGEPVPANDVLAVRAVPHALVLPRASVAIHHGGAGTVHAASRAGTPSVVVPFLADQPFWAAQLRRRGLAGPPLRRDRMSGEDVAVAIRGALDRQGAVDEVAREMQREDGTGAALRAITG